VYRAHDSVLDRAVALKEIHHDLSRSAVLAEARAAARISHPNVVIIHDVLDDGRSPIIAMELLDGPTLARVLSGGPLTPGETFGVACDLAAALQAAHDRGIVHCDIKPDNIFVTNGGRVVVTDFGLANPELGGGTPGYMAPEQYEGLRPAPTMDVFAWGVVCMEMCTGAPPFGIDPIPAEHRTRFEPPHGDLDADQLLAGFRELVFSALEKDPSGRPADGGALVAALTVLAADAPPTTIPSPRPRGPRRRRPVESRVPTPVAPRPAPAVAQAVRLLIYPVVGAPWYLDLAVGECVDAGRESALLLDDLEASRRHAQLYFDGQHLHVTDLGSLNGTIVNGERIHQCTVQPGDAITLGSTVLRVDSTY
jgi:serine/threonine protein kinase